MLKNKYNDYQNIVYQIHQNFLENNKSLTLVTRNAKESEYLFNALKIFNPNENIFLFPESEILPYDHFSMPEKVIKDRFQIINKISKHKHILVVSIKSLFEKYPTSKYFESFNKFAIKDNISVKNLIEIIESLNYSKKVNVESINEYAIRGGIIDIFSPIYENPLRIEIFDDKIESLRFFNIESQLSIKNIENFSISKGSFFSLDENKIDLFISKWRDYFHDYDERFCNLFQNIKNGIIPEGIEVYFPLLFDKTANFKDLFSKNLFLIFEDLIPEIENYSNFINERYDDEHFDQKRPILKPYDSFLEKRDVIEMLRESLMIKAPKLEVKPESFAKLIEIIESDTYKENFLVVTSLNTEVQKIKKMTSINLKTINQYDDINKGVNIMVGLPIRPFFDKSKNTYIFHKEQLEGSDYLNVINKKTSSIESKDKDFSIFKMKDLVVHENYGLGIYDGLEIVEANNTKNEYIKIIYANKEILYVPLSSINKITSYHKKNIETKSVLDSLSSTKWKIKKNKALKRSADHAAEILDIEARRQKSLSSSLKIDDTSLSEFNNDFPFEETNDQLIAFESIRKDMQLIKPMNRVLCGDVGFGKTEVAMRAAYTSVFSNKQVVIVCPSTILCDQHFNSFLKRFNNFPVNIEKLNRHNSLKNKNEIISKYNLNEVDILITTHIIFNNNIDFKNTGLLIVDEEHKFGIKQKNFIKDKQTNIHILYLSATPIPRTMNMVYAGLKDFSFLQTPPSNRTNIKSFLKIQTSQLIKEALSREKSRNGQCFILQNDISKMDSLKSEINEILPDFRVGIAHGKLNKKEILKAMTDFQMGNIDGLICTTIVEMGLDIPNANTMIIMNAQNFGLAQMHQLRGRVGRSEKQGYCYFMVPTMEIPKLSMSRLNSVIRHSRLGEGFLIAQEDLEIRGGGEMLGEKQSGHIENVGMSMYLSMLKTALNETNEINKNIEIEVNFYDSSFIDSKYLPSPIERLKIYRKINQAKTYEDIKLIQNNLIDRCGKMPDEVINLIDNKKIILMLNGSGIKSIKSNSTNTNFFLDESIRDDILNNLLDLVKKDPQKYSISKQNKFIYRFNELKSNIRRENVKNLINKIL